MRIRPKYKMELIQKVQKAIFDEYTSYTAVETYIREFWDSGYWNDNFQIYYKNDKNGKEVIDLTATLSNMPQDDLFRVAIDIGVPVPMVIPAFPTFVRTLAPEEKGISFAKEMFDKAYNLMQDDPAQAIGLANSTLETIVKHILQDPRTQITPNKNDTLYKLVETLLKEFRFFPTSDLQKNIRNIGSSLLCVCEEIEALRSDKTFVHGKEKGDYVIDNALYSAFVINAVSTVGLFIISYFEEKYGSLVPENELNVDDDCPF